MSLYIQTAFVYTKTTPIFASSMGVACCFGTLVLVELFLELRCFEKCNLTKGKKRRKFGCRVGTARIQRINSSSAILGARKSFSGPSEVCPHVPNRAGFFVPLRSTREYKPLVASTLCTVALLDCSAYIIVQTLKIKLLNTGRVFLTCFPR